MAAEVDGAVDNAVAVTVGGFVVDPVDVIDHAGRISIQPCAVSNTYGPVTDTCAPIDGAVSFAPVHRP
jgi:hypothetical protein